ncbi:MAG: hypothetical protein ACWA40_08975 [Planktomarina sp.]
MIPRFIISEEELCHVKKKQLSIVFLLISCVVALVPYTHQGWFFKHDVSIRPDFLSTLLSILLIAPLYGRGVLRWNASVYCIVSFLLFTFVFASILQIGLGGKDAVISKYLIAAGILLSFLGMKQVAAIAWVLPISAAVYNMVTINQALGMWGYVLIICLSLGTLLHSDLNPSDLISGIKKEYGGNRN